ncbi:hypothetical protein GW17_00057898 [Ensete ventricosum]|nr:hypothetical protein GW17_00057898 [Ensete ventricosum]
MTEDGRSTNPITDSSSSSEQLVLSRNPMETGHDRGDRSSDHNLSETSVVPMAEGRILTSLSFSTDVPEFPSWREGDLLRRDPPEWWTAGAAPPTPVFCRVSCRQSSIGIRLDFS